MSGKSVVTVTDKRTVHTDALDILGRVITADDKVGRDAIHLAVEPVIAGERVFPGQDVGRRSDGAFASPSITNGITKTLGIVDPFIETAVQPGEKFLLVIYPRQITSLQHVWEHPDFGPETANPATAAPETPALKMYHLILKDSGPNKISTIKRVRTITNLGLKDAKDLVDDTPSFILENVSYGTAMNGYGLMVDIAGVQVVEAKLQDVILAANPGVKPPSSAKPVKPVMSHKMFLENAYTPVAQKESKAWISSFAEDLKKSENWEGEDLVGHTFEEIMAIANHYLETGEYGYIGNSDIYDLDWKGFWVHYKVLTGEGPDDPDEGNFFSCSC